MPTAEEVLLDQLVAAVRASPKHRHVGRALIQRLGAIELGKGRSLKDAVKATKRQIHQLGGAYAQGPKRYADWTAQLAAARETSADAFHDTCLAIMGRHASTQERLPILDRFYFESLAELAPIRSVLDVACGLNPLALPWMPLADGAEYNACDVYEDLVGFVSGFLELAQVPGSATVCDLLGASPTQPVELALLLKSIPSLERVDPSAGVRLLDGLDAPNVLVSFPVRSLGGRSKGMTQSYDARFREIAAQRSWSITRFEYATELAFLVRR